MSVDVVDSVLAAARKEGGWDDTNKRKESLLDDTEEAGNEFHRVMPQPPEPMQHLRVQGMRMISLLPEVGGRCDIGGRRDGIGKVCIGICEKPHFSQPALVGGAFDSVATDDVVVFEVVVDLAVVVNLRVIAGGGEGIAVVSLQHIT
ncbi:hypothetical protein PRIPAC_97557 [Pristionchus pacificus]|uniref:Uncharacterized protein n=1 Tax=Pristionchus pacificus TaxID=54126 RepID=A0A2A6B305_PRIPA|nr:hypothetical protein PRIPAC_97557 [Pristionchus pacificus]|eukprot:PDM60248.1 hypothetical protein PRIPAC_54073 [Pristionchus pacificus]